MHSEWRKLLLVQIMNAHTNSTDSEWRKLLLVQNMNGHTNSTDSEWRKLLLVQNMSGHAIRKSYRAAIRNPTTIGTIGTIHRNHP